MSAFTPGPWAVRDGVGQYAYEVVGKTVRGKDLVVARIGGGAPMRGGNANLIAAAPDLLEALCSLGVIGGGYCFCSVGRDPDGSNHEPECRDARAAIAKALGQA